MYTNHVNPTALENQDHFCQALFSLMAQKPLEKISVTELCRAAGFERMTFYRHFDEKNDVIAYYLDRQMMLFLASMPARSTLQHNLENLFEWAYKERTQLCILMDHSLTTLLSQALATNIFAALLSNLSSEEQARLPAGPYAKNDQFLGSAVLGLFCGLLSAWRWDNFTEPANKVAHRMQLLLCGGCAEA